MTDYPYYFGQPATPPASAPSVLKTAKLARLSDSAGYTADDGLVKAVNVSLLLSQPLLLTGEPGTGKTQLAYSLAAELGYDTPLKFATKSTSVASDLFYTFNALSRFNAAYAEKKGSVRGLEFITYNALGLAILLANPVAGVRALQIVPEALRDGQAPPSIMIGKVLHTAPRRSVVLIDEIDKAPRDFPNDLLNEIEEMTFRIPELDNTEVRADPEMRPIVVITSNSEKNLPDAFLRRCVYYDIPFPDKARLRDIIMSRLGPRPDEPAKGQNNGDPPPVPDPKFVDDAIAVLTTLRDPKNGLRKRPATAELLGWMLALRSIAGDGVANPLRGDHDRVLGTVNVLIKTAADQAIATRIVSSWLNSVDPRTTTAPPAS
jgi:MoxR-like ATPase